MDTINVVSVLIYEEGHIHLNFQLPLFLTAHASGHTDMKMRR